MNLRKLRFLGVAAAAGALLLGSMSPANAAGGGVVSGTVTTSPGVPTNPTAAPVTNNVTFASTAISGTIQIGACVASGTVAVNATARATDTAAQGTGTVLTLSGTGGTAGTSINVALVSGAFTRTGSAVNVNLVLRASIVGAGGCAATANINVTVAANFTPLTTSGTAPNASVTSASFSGTFAVTP